MPVFIIINYNNQSIFGSTPIRGVVRDAIPGQFTIFFPYDLTIGDVDVIMCFDLCGGKMCVSEHHVCSTVGKYDIGQIYGGVKFESGRHLVCSFHIFFFELVGVC